MICKYEHGEAAPSPDAAKKIAKVFGVTLDYLAGETSDIAIDHRTVEGFQDIEKLTESEKGKPIRPGRCIPRQEQNAGDIKVIQPNPIKIRPYLTYHQKCSKVQLSTLLQIHLTVFHHKNLYSKTIVQSYQTQLDHYYFQTYLDTAGRLS